LLLSYLNVSCLTTIDEDFIYENNNNLLWQNNLQTIGGRIWIRSNSNLTTLECLAQLDYVNRMEIVRNGGLQNLTGLENIDSVELYLDIWENDDLLNLNGLANLKYVGDRLNILRNNQLTDLTGLENLNYGHTININENSSLNNLNGLNSLDTVTNLGISLNPQIKNLNGLDDLTILNQLYLRSNESLESLAGAEGINATMNGFELDISNSPALVDITQLSHLEKLYALRIFRSPLTDLAGLENLTCLHSLYLHDNQLLEDISALENISPDSLTSVTLNKNSQLSVCHIQPICVSLSQYDNYHNITNNAPGCITRDEILDNCLPVTSTVEVEGATCFIFPNPNTGIFQFNGITTGNYQITDTDGRVIQTGIIQTDTSVNISDAPKGVYFVSISQDDGKTFTQRIIKL